MNELFENIESKIKFIAKINFIIGSIASIIFAFVLFGQSEDYGEICVSIGFVLLFFGPLVSYIISVLLYGFGDLIETNALIAGRKTNKTIDRNIVDGKIPGETVDDEIIDNISDDDIVPTYISDSKIDKILSVYTNQLMTGKITEDEFNNVIKSISKNEENE